MTCLQTSRKLCSNTECPVCFKKSFASHPKASCWSSKNELVPRMILQSSDKKCYFDCDQCNHTFYSQLAAISRGQWCSYCANKKLCSNINCELCFEKSFASHPKSSQWSSQNEKTPRDYFRSSREKVWMDCPDCLHSNEVAITNITTKGQGCPYCSNKKLCSNQECQLCFEKSFASVLEKDPQKTFSWSPRNKLLPRDVFRSSTYRGLFDCHQCSHTFEAALHNATVSIAGAKNAKDSAAGHGCSYCRI